MSFKPLSTFGPVLSAFALWGLLAVSTAAQCESDESGAAETQTWRNLEQLTSWEKQRVDLRRSTPRDARVGYLPAEAFPFTAPYTAEEMGFRTMDFTHTARWSHVMADAFGTITKEGYLTQGVTVAMIDQMQSPNAQSQIAKKPGEAYSRHMYY